MKKNIFDLGFEGAALETAIEESDGELDPILEQWFDQLGDEREEKLEAYGFVIAEYEARAEAQRNKSKELAGRAAVNENKATRLRDRLKAAFEMFGWKKQKAGTLIISLVGNGGKRPVQIDNNADIPDDYFKPQPAVLDKELIRELLEGGEKLGFAELGERGKRIDIR